ncbi:MAG: hypothetical protein ACRECA_12685 [Pseudolabrys sp.]
MRKSVSIVLLVLGAVLATAPFAHAANCPQADISSAASDLQDSRNALMMLPSGKPADGAVAEMETRLPAFIRAYMRCQPENADVDGIEIDLSRLGWARVARDGTPAQAATPGWLLTFDAQPLGQGLISVSASFIIPSGIDTLAMTFQHRDDGWAETSRRFSVSGQAPVENIAPQ